jgi:hypothetical protein
MQATGTITDDRYNNLELQMPKVTETDEVVGSTHTMIKKMMLL